MSWTRREFLTGSAALAAAVSTGCSPTVRGEPRPGAVATPPAGTSSSVPPPPGRPTLGVIAVQPYTIEQGGVIVGPVPDVALAVLGKIGISDVDILTVRGEPQLLAGLEDGAFDLAGGLTIRPDLCDRLAFSIPDTVSGTALIVPDGNPGGLRTYAEIVAKGATVAVMTGLPERADALRAGVPEANLVQVPVPHQLVEAVRNGHADCAAFDDITARDLATTLGDGEVTTAGTFAPPGRPPLVGAYAFPLDSNGLLEQFNTALAELHDSGEWLELVGRYGFTDQNDPPAALRAERTCGS